MIAVSAHRFCWWFTGMVRKLIELLNIHPLRTSFSGHTGSELQAILRYQKRRTYII